MQVVIFCRDGEVIAAMRGDHPKFAAVQDTLYGRDQGPWQPGDGDIATWESGDGDTFEAAFQDAVARFNVPANRD